MLHLGIPFKSLVVYISSDVLIRTSENGVSLIIFSLLMLKQNIFLSILST